jgi:hypothetical protein
MWVFSLKRFASHLSRFPCLEILAIPDTSALNIGFDPPLRGNAYLGPDGVELRKQLLREDRVAQERAATEIFDKCLSLRELWLGDIVKVTVNRGNVLGSKKRDLVYHYKCPRCW